MKYSVVLGLIVAAKALLPIKQHANKFYISNQDYTKPGTEFTIVGVDYQPGGPSDFEVNGSSDILSDADTCLRDAYALQQLGVNTIRLYSVSPWLNHDECMSIFNEAGIYVLLDLNNPFQALTRKDPQNSYNEGYLNNVFGLVDAFKNYPNLLGFFSGNEVVNEQADDDVPKYLRAVTRDVKQYIKNHANRTIPVGYSAASVEQYRYNLWNYLRCGDASSTSDFYALNSYDWCGGATMQSSGYSILKTKFQNSSIPVFFSEYGCNVPSPRKFEEVTQGIYAKDGLADVFTGGLVYEYSQEANDYGLVEVDDDGNVKYQADFENLQDQLSQISLENATEPSGSAQQPPSCKGLDTIIDDFDLPDCPAQDLLKNGGGNTNIGKLVDVSSAKQKYKVENSNGDEQDGNISPVNAANYQINVPATSSSSKSSSSSAPASTSSSSSSSSSAPASTSTSSSSEKKKNKKNGAGRLGFSATSVFMALFALV